MSINSVFRFRCRMLLWIALALPVCASASNLLYLTGYGIESSLMGGADVAVSRDAFATVNNPAGLAQLESQVVEIELGPYTNMATTHTDQFGNYRKPFQPANGIYGNAAYAKHFANSPFSAGVGLIVQGGLGWTYHGLNTRFGTRDDASSLFSVLKLAPSVAWKANDQLSLGASLGVNYIGGSQELFPNTSCSACLLGGPFQGIRFKNASGINLSGKLGLQYTPYHDVTIGVTYATQTSIPLKNGDLRVNMSNAGLGVVRYDKARLDGFRLPEELAVGIAFRPTPRLLVSLQDKWYNWSEALNKQTITATKPRDSLAPATYVIPASLDAVDQHVIEIGLAYDYDQQTILYAGMNHGPRAIPDNNISPIFQAIHAKHIMFGASHKIDEEWTGAGGFEFFYPQVVTYDSPIFGNRASEHHYGVVFHMSLARRW